MNQLDINQVTPSINAQKQRNINDDNSQVIQNGQI